MLLELFLEVREGKASSLLPAYLVYLKVRTLCMGAPGGLYRPTPWGYNGNPTERGSQPSVSQAAVLPAGFSAGSWGPPPGGPCRLAWCGADRPRPPRAGLCRLQITVAVPLMTQARS